MKSPLTDILDDSSLSVKQKVEKTAEYLGSFPDRGVSEVLQFLLTTDDPTAATYLANYLALLPDLRMEKFQIVEHILNNKMNLMISAVNLVKFLHGHVIEQLINEYFRNPSSMDMHNILFEIAKSFPFRLHRFATQIDNKYIREAMLAGGPESWVDDLVEKYRYDGNPLVLQALSRFHTDKAVEALLTLQPIVPSKDQENLYMYIESSGVFPDTREASVYFKTYRGFIVSRDESPHHMGLGFPYAVPKCPICDTAATRILTLDIAKLDFDLESDHNPSFFWYQCPHPPSYVVVRYKEDGIEGMMSPMTDGPVKADFLPGEVALLLEEHPNQFGLGIEANPSFGNHQVGGYPPWVSLERFPRCPGCKKGMKFLASIDSGMTPFGNLGFDGMLYGFWCEACAISATCQQTI